MKKTLFTLIMLMAAFGAFAQCSASFTYTFAPTGNNLLNYNFTNTSTWTYGPGYVPSYSLNYGDGNTQNNFYGTASHNYSAAGTYTVTLTQTIYDSLNQTNVCTSTSSQVITAAATACATAMSYTVTAVNNNSEDIACTATNPAGTPGMTYSWTFGDGGTGTGANPTHTYTSNGTFNIILIATGGGCTYTNTTTITVNGIFDCNSATTSFTSSVTNATAYFTPSYTLPNNGQNVSLNWDYGDGNTGYYAYHTYTATGTYTVNLTTEWIDSLNGGNMVLCTKTASGTVTITNIPPPPANKISGYIGFAAGNPANTSCKVWLIKYDSLTNILSAVDSTTSSLDSISYYEFNNEPYGNYRVKAALINNNTPGTSGWVPTYSYTSLYWSGANAFYYFGGTSSGHNITMQYGIVPSGSGFIAGNVLYGANKKTQGGAPETGMMIYLRNASNNVITYTYTDANGNFSFSNVANGTYSVYPEAMNYATTPITNISVNGTVNNIDFYKHTMSMTITPNTEGVNNVVNVNSVAVFPNPTSGNITLHWNTVKSENAQISVADITGRKVFSAPVNMSAGSADAKLNLSQLPEGVYIMNIKSADLNQVEKINISK